MYALCTCCFVTFQAMSSMEVSENVGTPAENLANDEDHCSGSEGTPAAEALALEPNRNQPPNRSQSPNPKEKQKSTWQITSHPQNAFVCDRIRS